MASIKPVLALGLAVQPTLAWAADMIPGPSQTTVGKIIDLIIEAIVKYSFQVLGGIVVLAVGWIIAKFLANFVENVLKRYHVDITVSKFLVGAVKLAVMVFAGLVALGEVGIEIAPFIAGLSVIGFGTSFALQGPLSNYAAGATLIFTKPFKVGDIIEVANMMGEVQDLTLACTVLRTVDDTTIVVPNKHIIGEIIHNYTGLKRLDIKVGVGYKTDMDRALAVLREVVKQERRVHWTNEPKVGIADFGDSSVNLYARLWCKQADYWDVMFSINKQIFETFRKNDIEIPFPQRDIHLHEAKG